MRGIAADVSYSCVIGSNPTFDELDAGLALVLDRFRQLQRFAFDIALRVESQLQPGMSEYEVRTLMRAAQAHAEVAQVFHEPYAWFGPRTTLGQDWAPDIVKATVVAARGMAPSATFDPTA